MRRVFEVLVLIREFIEYFLCHFALRRKRPHVAFEDFLLGRLANGNVPSSARAFLLGYVIVGTLKYSDFQIFFQTLEKFDKEVPWERMSSSLLRKTFEAAIIDDRLPIARRALQELSGRALLAPTDLGALARLLDWRCGRIADESTIRLDRRYFEAYPAYDPYFKGRVLSSAGKSVEAHEHFRKCLELAPLDARELREDVMRRLSPIGSTDDSSGRTGL